MVSGLRVESMKASTRSAGIALSCGRGARMGQADLRSLGFGFVLANRTIIGAFAARPVVLGTLDPRPLPPLRLPKHVRYQAALHPVRFMPTNTTEPGRTAKLDWPELPRLAAASCAGAALCPAQGVDSVWTA
jgi:hypothetical protein